MPQADTFHAQETQHHLRIAEMTIQIGTIHRRTIVSENGQHQSDNTDAHKRDLHQAVHQQRYIVGKIETVNRQTEHRSD